MLLLYQKCHSNTYVQYKHKLFNLPPLKTLCSEAFFCNTALFTVYRQCRSTCKFRSIRKFIPSFVCSACNGVVVLVQYLMFHYTVFVCLRSRDPQRVLHSTRLVLQSGKFVNARSCREGRESNSPQCQVRGRGKKCILGRPVTLKKYY